MQDRSQRGVPGTIGLLGQYGSGSVNLRFGIQTFTHTAINNVFKNNVDQNYETGFRFKLLQRKSIRSTTDFTCPKPYSHRFKYRNLFWTVKFRKWLPFLIIQLITLILAKCPIFYNGPLLPTLPPPLLPGGR